MKSPQSFIHKLDMLISSGACVIAVRTREPFRLMPALAEYMIGERDLGEFRHWTRLSGWSEPVSAEKQAPFDILASGDDDTDIFSALRRLTPRFANTDVFPQGMYAMTYPHWDVASPMLIQLLAEYSIELGQKKNSKVLVLCVPEVFTLPVELNDAVAVLDFSVPTVEELKARFVGVIKEQEMEADSPFQTDDVAQIAGAGLGLTLLEFERVVLQSIAEHNGLSAETNLESFIEVIAAAKVEVVNRTEMLQVIPSISIKNVGGMENIKAQLLRDKVAASPAGRRFGIKPPKGMLAVGVPGTGKSLLARATGGVLGLQIIRLDIAKCFGSFVGESERKMDIALKFIKSMSPCVVWVDEIDKAGFGGGKESNGGTSDRVLGQVLYFMAEESEGISWLFTANRAKGIPTELIRKGRLGSIWGLNLPNSTERLEILKIHLRIRKKKVRDVKDLALAVAVSKGYIGAEIEEAVNNALIESFINEEPITGALIAQELGKMKPLSQTHADDMRAMSAWVEKNAMPASKSDEELVDAKGTTRRLKVKAK